MWYSSNDETKLFRYIIVFPHSTSRTEKLFQHCTAPARRATCIASGGLLVSNERHSFTMLSIDLIKPLITKYQCKMCKIEIEESLILQNKCIRIMCQKLGFKWLEFIEYQWYMCWYSTKCMSVISVIKCVEPSSLGTSTSWLIVTRKMTFRFESCNYQVMQPQLFLYIEVNVDIYLIQISIWFIVDDLQGFVFEQPYTGCI